MVIGYLGYTNKPAPGLYTSALAIELLHDFMLIHDDIIDKSATRRGKPSMHTLLNDHLKKFPGAKFTGDDLGIVVGDVIYALAIHAFLKVRVAPKKKEAALKKLVEAALYTGSGEFIELMYGLTDIGHITRKDIYSIYDLKTANYTFASPLSIGAILAGASPKETKSLFDYGLCLGRAFQIKDDILGIFSEEAEIGKSILTDLQEAKKTILIWYAYHHSNTKEKKYIYRIFSKKLVTISDLHRMREIISDSGALAYAQKEVTHLQTRAHALLASSGINGKYKSALGLFSRKLLTA